MSDPIQPSDQPIPLTAATPPQYDPSVVARARNLLDEMPEQIGRYRILERIGGGGMGEVYRAEQRSPVRREVAIKVIKLGMDTRLVIARFEAERQALAMMDHPNIAKVYDADADETGRPYFVMEYVKGKPITEYADVNHLSIDERLELFEQVCHAIQHAHQKGIIHRDLKPSNVLVSTQDGKPLAKVIDFGIAKATSQRLTDKTLYTQHEQFIGTPQYVSPEQADGSLDIDMRTDVYSLGVLLYELLTGSTPFASEELRAAAVDKIKQMIRDVDPPKPSTRLSMSTQTLPTLAAARRVDVKKLGSLVRGELDWIVMKALEKDRRRRYETPAALANDIRAHLRGESVTAAPPTAGYRLRKFAFRHKTPLSVAAAVALVLIAGSVVSVWQALRAGRAERTVSAQLVEVDQQRKNADESRQAAQAAQAVAEREAKLAAKSASLAQARYLIQQGDLPGAMTSIKAAAAGGLTYADRLVLDEAYRAARDHWSLVSHVRIGSRPGSGCIVDFDDGSASVVAVVDNQMISFPTDTPNPRWQRVALDAAPRALVASRVGTVIGWTSSGRVRAFAVAADKLAEVASHDFEGEIDDVAASDKTVTLLFVDGSCRMLDVRTLQVVHEWPATVLPESIRSARSKHCFTPPDGSLVIIHQGAWNTPAYAIRPGMAKATEITNIRMGFLAFGRPSPAVAAVNPAASQSFVTWLTPSSAGGLPDELSLYSIDADLKVEYRDFQTVDSIDTKRRVAFRRSPTGRLTMFGEVGVTWIESRYSRATLPSERYTSFWPFPESEPEFFAADETGERVVLSINDGLVAFDRNNESPSDMTLDNYSSWGIGSGVLKVVSNGQKPSISLEPYDATRAGWSVTPQWILPASSSAFPGFSPWRIHVTPDERYAVILAQEDDGGDTISSQYGRKVAMVYNLQGEARRAQGWQSARQVEFAAAAGVTGFSNGVLRITPDGKTVLLGVKGQLFRGDIASGRPLDTLDFGQSAFDLSRDGKLVAGRITSMHEAAVLETSSGRQICTLAGIDSLEGAAFSDDDASVIVNCSGNRVTFFDLPSGRQVWTKKSSLVPRNWPATGDEMLAMAPETTGDGALLMLADKNTLQPLGVVSKTIDHLSDCGFSPLRQAIGVQSSRWQTRIIHMVEPDGLARLLATPAGADDTAGDEAVVDARDALLPTSNAGTDAPLRGEELAQITKYMDRVVTVEANIATVHWTVAHNAVTIECAKEGARNDAPALLIWINPSMLRKLRAAGMELDADKPTLEGKHLRVHGRVGLYGGYDSTFAGHPEIYLEDPKGVEILEQAN